MKYYGFNNNLMELEYKSDEERESSILDIDEDDRLEDEAEKKGGRSRKSPAIVSGEHKILCRICGDGAVRHVHYGGHCCFSCKAFFRRAVNWQNKNNRDFKCKFEGVCEITIKNRKTCQSCRFQKCISTGMNPSWVLSDDQRRKRFKKYREQGELSPTNDQDSSKDADSDAQTELGSSRKRVKSAPDRRGPKASADKPMSSSNPVSPVLQHSPRMPHCSGSSDVKPIKTEPILSPLRNDSMDFDLDGMDHTPVKVETDDDIKLEELDKLQNLISSCDFGSDIVPSNEAKEEPPDSMSFSGPDNLPMEDVIVNEVPRNTMCIELSQNEMLSLIKLEMSFENSNKSFPVMSTETSSIWNAVISSCKLDRINNSLANSLLSEAVELCLRRNLIFLQENADFTSLTVDTRKHLYIQNMSSMCHVRGVLQQSNRSRNFTCIRKSNTLQISYRNQRTGETTLWNLSEGMNGEESRGGPSNLLELAEDIWRLELERGIYLILLLVVLFSSQGCNLSSCLRIIDRFQNKYLALLYRYLQAKYGQSDAKNYLTTLMKFVLAVLSNTF